CWPMNRSSSCVSLVASASCRSASRRSCRTTEPRGPLAMQSRLPESQVSTLLLHEPGPPIQHSIRKLGRASARAFGETACRTGPQGVWSAQPPDRFSFLPTRPGMSFWNALVSPFFWAFSASAAVLLGAGWVALVWQQRRGRYGEEWRRLFWSWLIFAAVS